MRTLSLPAAPVLALLAHLAACASIPTRPTERLPMVEIEINNTAATVDDYVTWSPTQARARIANGNEVSGAYTVVLRNMDPGGPGGQLLFAASQNPWPAGTTATQPALTLTLPQSGAWVPFVLAGEFGHPSTRDKDAVIEAKEDRPDGVVLGRKALMVRVRKNANTLTADERDRFLRAMATLNLQMNNYDDFRAIHAVASTQAHSDGNIPHTAHAFLPWHRALVLRIERELQAIDPSVALPYWRFDQGAINVFHADFMGITNTGNQVTFAATNPLLAWTALGVAGVQRKPTFAPGALPPLVISQATTLALGGAYASFRAMEGNPHGPAHTQAGGSGNWIAQVAPAVRDPLFFLLHANVDRLWATWQHLNGTYDPAQASSYTLLGNAPSGVCLALGQHALDTMWPWNGAVSPGDPCRPATAPGGAFPAAAPALLYPPAQPRPHDLVEFRQGGLGGAGGGFAYDDIPFS
ncbi:MAG TPA: tyrosinase family protein [Longimicrobium sp.]|nr:tyrosinase family protein [Longimicrobium sp.]